MTFYIIKSLDLQFYQNIVQVLLGSKHCYIPFLNCFRRPSPDDAASDTANAKRVFRTNGKYKQEPVITDLRIYYTNIYGHERLWLKLWARGDCNCAILLRGAAPKQNSAIVVTEGP